MQTLIWSNLYSAAKKTALARPSGLKNIDVSEILESVRTNGDAAIISFTQKFDDVKLENLKISTPSLKNRVGEFTKNGATGT